MEATLKTNNPAWRIINFYFTQFIVHTRLHIEPFCWLFVWIAIFLFRAHTFILNALLC